MTPRQRVTVALAVALLAAPAARVFAAPRGLPPAASARVDALFAAWSGNDRPGCAVGIVRDGAPAFARGYGMANLEHDVPIDARTRFDVGSVSKQLTAGAIALLVSEGRLGLDDDVRRYVPELPDHGAPVTIRHLLHHRGGLRDYTTLMALAGDDDADLTTTGEALATLARQRGVDFTPGKRFEYSNSGYFLLGLVVERASGMPLARFAEERLFAPLGMTSTHFQDDHTRIVPRRAQGYAKTERGYGIAMSDWEQVGDGSLFTTVEDVARWIANLESGKVGGPRFVELMASPGLPTSYGDGSTYGFGRNATTWRGRQVWRHGGAWAGYRAHLLHLPKERLAVAILCNSAEARELGGKADAVAALALGEEPDRPPAAPQGAAAAAEAEQAPPAAPPPPRFEPLAGLFWSDELGVAWQLAVRGGRLAVVAHDGGERPLLSVPATAPAVTSAAPLSTAAAPASPAPPPAPVASSAAAPATGEPTASPSNEPATPGSSAPARIGFSLDEGSHLLFAPRPDGDIDGFELQLDPSASARPGIRFRRIDAAPRSLRIVNARLVDGTGAPARSGSLRIVGDRIAAVGDVAPLPGDEVIDARGLVLAPGFIDTHSHADDSLLALPEALGAVSQGITTIVGGQDGGSPLPLADAFARLERAPAAVNVASYSGHGTLREKVLGEGYRRAATAAEVEQMARLLERDLEAGALGLSTGLEYDPGIYSTRAELIALAKVAARHGGRYISHVRSEDRWFWEAIDEILAIGREARLPVQISHLKLAMTSLWGKAPELLRKLDAARRQGVDVTADVYPYLYWQSTLTVLFPKRDFEDLAEARRVLAEIAPADGLLLGRYLPNPAYAGRTVADIATERGEEPAVTLLALIRDAEAMRRRGAEEVESVIGTSMTEADLEQLLAWPHANLCTDGELDGRHPRGFGSYPRVLGRYVRERGTLGLEEAVRKMTSLAADHVGIRDRGRLVPGAYADLVLFDPAAVLDRATTTDPHALASGIERVWVNGRTVFAGGSPSGLRPGRVLRRAGVKP